MGSLDLLGGVAEPVTTYRLAGDVLAMGDRTYLPLQGYGSRREYGHLLGFFHLAPGGAGKPRSKRPTYLTGGHFDPRWDFVHHASNQWDGNDLILAVDGHAAGAGWEIGIFRVDVRHTLSA